MLLLLHLLIPFPLGVFFRFPVGGNVPSRVSREGCRRHRARDENNSKLAAEEPPFSFTPLAPDSFQAPPPALAANQRS
eukprot:4456141-Pyramimonas_sp.AAC.1